MESEPDMASCITACSNNPKCEGAGYDSSTGMCSQYCSEVPGSGTYSPNVQFAQLRQRAVVNNGQTSLYDVTTS